MPHIHLVTSSHNGEQAYSTRLGRAIVAELSELHPGATLTTRDLFRDPVPYIDVDFARLRNLDPTTFNPAEQALLALSDALIAELVRADFLIVASPMINLGLPAVLKSWTDHLVRDHVTMRFVDESGRGEGLVTGKKVFLAHSRGQRYSSGPMLRFDHQDSYLRLILSALGMDDITTIAVEGYRTDRALAETMLADLLASLPDTMASAGPNVEAGRAGRA